MEIDLLVIHAISLPPGQFGGTEIDDFFLNRLKQNTHPYFSTIAQQKVSSHILIDRKGKLTQYVPFDKRAWHAGTSRFQGRENCNDFSIGIELEGADDILFEQLQYQSLAKITTILMEAYPGISKKRIVGHNAIAPERKTDPGPNFDWDYYFSLLKDEL